MIVDFAELPAIRQRHAGEIIALGSGVFDLLHPGHLQFLEFVRSLGDVAVVGVSADSRVRERKGPDRPIRSEQDRLAVVNGLRCVNYALIAPEYSADATPTAEIVRALSPDILVTTDDRWQVYQDILEAAGTQVVKDTRPPLGSTTAIIETIRQRRVDPN